MVGKIPVSSLNFIIQSWISYAVPTTTNEGTNLIYVKVSSNPEVKIVHTYGYKLPVEFFALQSSSTSDEISTTIGGEEGLKKIVKVFNPAFDVTDHELIAGIVTEYGVARAPYTESLAAIFAEKEKRAREKKEA